VRQHFARVESDWQQFQTQWLGQKPMDLARLEPQTVAFVEHIDALVNSIEAHMSAWTAALHVLQIGVLVLALLAAGILLFAGYRFVLEPVNHLELAIRKIQAGDFAARVELVGSDGLGRQPKVSTEWRNICSPCMATWKAKFVKKPPNLKKSTSGWSLCMK
jgi:two-component system nitrate/nitrite sensor histidine kinase NarX